MIGDGNITVACRLITGSNGSTIVCKGGNMCIAFNADIRCISAIAAADHFIPLENFGPALAEVPLPAGAYYVVATFSHATDGEALGGVLHHRDAAYTGMIGRKIAAIREKLLAQGITPAQLAAVHAPIGLSLGGEAPEEIAVSILAELLMTRYGKTKADL